MVFIALSSREVTVEQSRSSLPIMLFNKEHQHVQHKMKENIFQNIQNEEDNIGLFILYKDLSLPLQIMVWSYKPLFLPKPTTVLYSYIHIVIYIYIYVYFLFVTFFVVPPPLWEPLWNQGHPDLLMLSLPLLLGVFFFTFFNLMYCIASILDHKPCKYL